MQITTESIEWWLKIGSMYGIGIVAVSAIIGIFLYVLTYGARGTVQIVFAVRDWIPKLVGTHISYVEKQQATTERITLAVETLADNHGISGQNHTRTHRAIRGMIGAAKEAARHANMEQVLSRLEEAEEELERP